MIEKKGTAEKIKVMQAYLSGETLEATTDGISGWMEWGRYQEPAWNWEQCDYRIKEEDYTLDIPWELIQKKWKWAAMDKNGEVFLFECEPTTGSSSNIWVSGWEAAEFFLEISTPDTKHWDKTLTKRPEGE